MRTGAWKLLPFALAIAACGSSPVRARLEGMLDPASLADSRGQPVQVSVTGTSRATATDASGQFVFDDLAPGDATLRFRGRGFDVTVRISGLVAGQTLQITVQIAARGCVVRRARANEIALVGAIGSATASSITVSGVEVDTDANTRIEDRDETPLTLADLKVGDVVRVEGMLQAGGKVLAREIERVTAPGQNEALLRGLVSAVDASKSTFAVSGLTVSTDASTRLVGIATLADLNVGDRVLVQGTLQPDGSVKARLVVRRPVAPPEREETELEGAITSITPPDRFEVAGKTVVVDSSTRFEGEHDSGLTFADLKVGDRVEVEGVAQADGTVLARKVERDDEEEDHH
jgi:Domain of unknown function (DUF5666)/Carboxypeptidase regulatory-like domain